MLIFRPPRFREGNEPPWNFDFGLEQPRGAACRAPFKIFDFRFEIPDEIVQVEFLCRQGTMITEAQPHVTRNEGLIFERSSPGKTGAELPPLDVPAVSPEAVLGSHYVRDEMQGFPEVSELEVIRHFTRLSTWNYGIDTGLYPLGSCTMKYNPRINEVVASLDGLATDHPLAPELLAQGCLRILYETAQCLAEITGMDAVSLQPSAGAQGELTGLL